MKYLYVVALVFLFVACEKDEKNTPQPAPAPTAPVLFYSSYPSPDRWGLKIDGQDKGLIGQADTEPSCGNTNFQNFNLTIGGHHVEVYPMSGQVGGYIYTIAILNSSCQQIELP